MATPRQLQPVPVEARWKQPAKAGSTATFGQDRLGNYQTSHFLDGLAAQGVPIEFLRQFANDPLPRVTSILLRSGFSREVMNRALQIADSYEGVSLTGGDLSKLSPASRLMYALDLRGYPEASALVGQIVKDKKGTPIAEILKTLSVSGVPPEVLNNAGFFAEKPKDQKAYTAAQQTALPFTIGKTGGLAPPPGVAGSQRGFRGEGVTRQEVTQKTNQNALADMAGPETPLGDTGTGGGTDPFAGLDLTKEMTPDEIRAQMERTYGWAAGLADIPEIAGILNDAYNGKITSDVANNKFLNSEYYKTTTKDERAWRMYETTDPADAAETRRQQYDKLAGMFDETGGTFDPARIQTLADLSLRYGWDDSEIRKYIAAEVRFDPTNTKTGVMTDLKNIARDWLVPLSDQAMTAWAQSVVSGTKTEEDFTTYLRNQAKSLFPALGTALDDPNITTRSYLSPYGEIASRTLGVNSADIDWTDPKWMRAINTIDPKTNQRGVMPLADWQRTMMTDPIYDFDNTANGQKAKQDMTFGLMRSFGFDLRS